MPTTKKPKSLLKTYRSMEAANGGFAVERLPLSKRETKLAARCILDSLSPERRAYVEAVGRLSREPLPVSEESLAHELKSLADLRAMFERIETERRKVLAPKREKGRPKLTDWELVARDHVRNWHRKLRDQVRSKVLAEWDNLKAMTDVEEVRKELAKLLFDMDGPEKVHSEHDGCEEREDGAPRHVGGHCEGDGCEVRRKDGSQVHNAAWTAALWAARDLVEGRVRESQSFADRVLSYLWDRVDVRHL